LQLPSPLAFNYHYDLSLNPGHQQQEPRQDQFRGLAFANFRNGEEASVVVCALNGFEFMVSFSFALPLLQSRDPDILRS